jgi:hypothetical protein
MVDSLGAAIKLTILPEKSEKRFVVETAAGTLALGTAEGFEEVVASHQGLRVPVIVIGHSGRR